jgi:DNA ligase-1
MNKPWNILKEIAATDSKNEKQVIIAREAKAGNDLFFRGLRLTFDNMLTFGVKQIETKPAKRASEPDPKGLDPEKFFELTQKLSMRTVTGDAAKVAINHVMNQATAEEWDGWYRLILIKDLKAGFSESTINKVTEKAFPKYAIPVFETMLAFDGANCPEKIVGKKIIESKLDGARCITIVYPNGKVDQYSRNGKELLNFQKIKDQIAKNAIFFAEPVVLDGEIMSASFQDLMKQARRKTNVQTDDCILNLFDIITLREFQTGKGDHKQMDRSFSLHAWFDKLKDSMPNVDVLTGELVDLDTPEGSSRFVDINKMALDGGYEGILIKDPDAVYECKRSNAWLKKKPTITVDLKIVEVEEGDGNFVGTMGALVCEGTDQGRKIRVNCGGGYSIQSRAQIWADHTGKPVTWQKKEKSGWVTMTEQPTGTKILGQTVEVMADVISKSDSSDTYSLRFPRFVRFRDDK